MSNELVAFSSLDCGILMVQRCKLPGEPICQILEEQTGERVGSFGSRGQGPGEFIAAEFIGKTEGDDTLYFVNLPSTVLLYAREEKGGNNRIIQFYFNHNFNTLQTGQNKCLTPIYFVPYYINA